MSKWKRQESFLKPKPMEKNIDAWRFSFRDPTYRVFPELEINFWYTYWDIK